MVTHTPRESMQVLDGVLSPLSPLRGMETCEQQARHPLECPTVPNGSEPTVWDGDCFRIKIFASLVVQDVPSPPCGMATPQIHIPPPGGGFVLSPPCGMVTTMAWLALAWFGLFQAHWVGWRRQPHPQLKNHHPIPVPSPLRGMATHTPRESMRVLDGVLSPPCGMVTRGKCSSVCSIRWGRFRAHRVGWRPLIIFLTNDWHYKF